RTAPRAPRPPAAEKRGESLGAHRAGPGRGIPRRTGTGGAGALKCSPRGPSRVCGGDPNCRRVTTAHDHTALANAAASGPATAEPPPPPATTTAKAKSPL